MSGSDFTCPCCGFMVFGEGPGSYEVCSICGWEDDAVQLANGDSLHESQQKVLLEHPLSTTEVGGVTRDPAWRPLSDDEVQAHRAEVRAAKTLWPRKAASDAKDCYWLKK